MLANIFCKIIDDSRQQQGQLDSCSMYLLSDVFRMPLSDAFRKLFGRACRVLAVASPASSELRSTICRSSPAMRSAPMQATKPGMSTTIVRRCGDSAVPVYCCRFLSRVVSVRSLQAYILSFCITGECLRLKVTYSRLGLAFTI